jgi:hypothetical protein
MNQRFGETVAIDGDFIVVGATRATGKTSGTGAVYVYKISEDSTGKILSISEEIKLTASDGKSNESFGTSVAIHGNFILVGANRAENNAVRFPGAAYLFGYLPKDSNSPPQWTQLLKFQPTDLETLNNFGTSVALDENIAVIGAPGIGTNAVYVFAPVDPLSPLSSSWNQITKITQPTKIEFGFSVAVAGSWLVVGAYGDDTKGTDAGAVFVYTKTSSSLSPWTQTTQLFAVDGVDDDNFGTSVAISKDASTIVVGADFDDFNDSIIDSGAAYLFWTNSIPTTSTSTWTQAGKFLAKDPVTDDILGSSIAIKNNIVVVGAGGDNSGKGIVYLLDAAIDEDTGKVPCAPKSNGVWMLKTSRTHSG